MGVLQSSIDLAYTKWTADLSFDDFIITLEQKQKLAVLVGKLNYQIGNGGFYGWYHNGYCKSADSLLSLLNTFSKEPIIAEVIDLIEKALVIIAKREIDIKNADSHSESDEYDSLMSEELDDLDNKYYEIEDDFLSFMEKTYLGGN